MPLYYGNAPGSAPFRGVSLRDLGRDDSHQNESQSFEEVQNSLSNFRSDMPLNVAAGTVSDGRAIHPGRPYAAAGLAQALTGTADVVNVDVAQRLVAFSDPIRAIMGTSVHTTEKVIIKRKYVAGGGAQIVPERAAARTVAVQEETKECVLVRYGSDIEWNLNLMLNATEFQRDFQLKVNAQKEALQNAAIAAAYDAVMTEGTSLTSALVASNYITCRNNQAASTAAERIRVTSVFGAMQRFPYPIHNILASIKYCQAYAIASADNMVLIVPHGAPELHTYTKGENMISHIHGIKHGDPLTAKVTGGAKDVGSGVTVFCHQPPAMNSFGAARPTASPSMLANEVVVLMYCKQGSYYYHHLERTLKMATKDIVRVYVLSMLSAIAGIPNGPDQQTGEILIGYPSTTLGSDVSSEVGRMRLRCYIGAALFKPENVVVVEDVAFNGIRLIDQMDAKEEYTPNKNAHYYNTTCGNYQCDGNQIVYQGAEYDSTGRLLCPNNGHMGCVDSIECGDRVFGTHVFSGTPSVFKMGQMSSHAAPVSASSGSTEEVIEDIGAKAPTRKEVAGEAGIESAV